MVKASSLPSLNELRSFESVARLKSVSAAAVELGCSQPCVSHRIKTLEQRWSVVLFRRTTRALEWTDHTQRIYQRTCNVLAEIEAIAAETLIAVQGTLSISVSPSLASCWLVGRLPAFREQHPEIEVKLSATNRFVDLTAEGFDLAIRLLPIGTALSGQLVAVPLTEEKLIIVASHDYLARWPKGYTPAQLAGAALLWQADTDHWQRFFDAYLADGPLPNSGPIFNNADLVVRSAADGQGVAVIRQLLVGETLNKGQLVRAFPESIACSDAYHLVCPTHKLNSRPVQDFLTWVKADMDLSVAGQLQAP